MANFSDESNPLLLNASIGTPRQPATFVLDIFSGSYDLVVSKATNDGGIFDPSKSSSFVEKEDIYDGFLGKNVGINGTDIFTLPDGTVLNSKLFDVLDARYYKEPYGDVSLDRPLDGSVSFIHSILKEQEEEILVFTFDNVISDTSQLTKGLLTFGVRPSGCSTQWTYLSEVKTRTNNDSQWTVDVDELSIGKYTVAEAGQLKFRFSGDYLQFPTRIYDSVLHALNADDFGYLPCDITVDLIYSFGEYEIKIGPDVYLEKLGDYCIFVGKKTEVPGTFELPANLLLSRCLLYDYKNKKVGIADKLN